MGLGAGTLVNNPGMKCQYHPCNNFVPKHRTKYCSTKCSTNFNSMRADHRLKLRCCEYKGGRCNDCGYDDLQYLDVFDFHHLDPKEKDFSISKVRCSWDKMQPELDKCVMLCARCHRIRHAKENLKTRPSHQLINHQTSPSDIDLMRKLYKGGNITVRELSVRFGISKSNVHRLIRGCILDSQKKNRILETQVGPH